MQFSMTEQETSDLSIRVSA